MSKLKSIADRRAKWDDVKCTPEPELMVAEPLPYEAEYQELLRASHGGVTAATAAGAAATAAGAAVAAAGAAATAAGEAAAADVGEMSNN